MTQCTPTQHKNKEKKESKTKYWKCASSSEVLVNKCKTLCLSSRTDKKRNARRDEQFQAMEKCLKNQSW
jgi:hypothetical protein